MTVLEAAETIGGGTRSGELTLPGLIHDDCSAVHPMAGVSPFLSSLDLGRHGLEWAWPKVDLAHPLDGGDAAVLVRSLAETADGLADDGPAWRRLFERPARGFDGLSEDSCARSSTSPATRFAWPASASRRRCRRPRWRATGAAERARALFGGVAAHAFSPLTRPMSSAVGMALITACHHGGWPVARGGSQSITDALAAVLHERGGKIETGVRVGSLEEVAGRRRRRPRPRPAVGRGDRRRAAAGPRRPRLPPLPPRPGRVQGRPRGRGRVPWENEACRRAGTVHAIGSFDEIVAAERDTNRGRMPERPFVLVGQQYLADPGRSAGDLHPVWAYAHVPQRLPRRRDRGR